ncbi:hypothetical protein H6785_02940 [Candidatus Nomurabacteria bacterium]|nr:hypothetical protein [Candidatus Nomurabacteria bacterium]
MKITIIGHAGCGKSWLSGRIAKKLGVPHLHLDQIWMEVGGHLPENRSDEAKERVRQEVLKKADAFTNQDSWVSDGWYNGAVQKIIAVKADQIIFIDIPLWKRVLNHLIRSCNRKDRHAQLSFWDDLKFTKQLIVRTKKWQPYFDDFLQMHVSKVVVLKSRKEIGEYIKVLESDA